MQRVTDSNGIVGYDRLGSSEIVYVRGDPKTGTKLNENWAHHGCSMTGVAIASSAFMRKGDPSIAKGAKILGDNLPRLTDSGGRSGVDFCYWYWGTEAIYTFEGPTGATYKKWSAALDAVRKKQAGKEEKCGEGMWNAYDDRWGWAGGTAYTTAMGALTLEVPLRPRPGQ
jgi:hypothetical protein